MLIAALVGFGGLVFGLRCLGLIHARILVKLLVLSVLLAW